MRTFRRFCLTSLGLLIVPSTGFAQTPDALLRVGDSIPGLGAVTGVFSVQMLDSGTYVALIDTDFPMLSNDGAVVRDGLAFLREGQQLEAPLFTAVIEIDSMHANARGHVATRLQAFAGGPLEALAWDQIPIVLSNSPLVDPLVGASTQWLSFDVCKMNTSNEVFALGDVSNPDAGGPRDATLCKFSLEEDGNLRSVQVLLTIGQFLPALGTTSICPAPSTPWPSTTAATG